MTMLRFALAMLCVSANAAGQTEEYPTPVEAVERGDVPKGTLDGPHEFRSTLFPGTVREYWVYVPAGYDPQSPPCLMVVQDGINKARGWKLPTVLDNMIHDKQIPRQLGVFVSPGVVPAAGEQSQPRFNRSFEYDSMGDRYARFLVEELLPEVAKTWTFSDDPNDRCIAGSSSGGICAFTAAWERPDQFRRVFCTVGTFVGLRGGNEYPVLVRKCERRPIRIFLQDGSNDLDIYAGSWWNANQTMLSAMQFSGYDVKHVWGEGGHNNKHGAAVLPEGLKWLWRDYPQPVTNVPGKPRRTNVLAGGHPWQMVASGGGPVVSCAAAPDGSVWFADRSGVRIRRLGPDETVTEIATLEHPVTRLAMTPGGHSLACCPEAGAIFKVTANGVVDRFAASTADSLLVLPGGNGFATDTKNGQLQSFTSSGSVQQVDELFRPTALAISPDRSTLTVAGQNGRFCHSYRVTKDGGVTHRQEYGWLHVTDRLKSAATAASVDVAGFTYISTALGIQVLDQLGRVHLIINSPSASRVNDLTFGGADGSHLFVCAGGRLYARRLNATGLCPWAPAVKPPRPRL
ncbi:MAG: alpha/beta hydrolase-fold protein [Planctomycetaceae bacterium]|nr:alpha/beta hydrolase-fold protein [Planctomycetaceae bacterium]